MLQTWAQTAFYYYAIYTKIAFSYGDTISEVAPGVVRVLKKSGFVFSEADTKPKVWVFYIGEKNDGYVIYSKSTNKPINDKENVVVSICVDGEPTSNVGDNAYTLPYNSPIALEKTINEKTAYENLNRQIAIEMLYLAEKTKDFLLTSDR